MKKTLLALFVSAVSLVSVAQQVSNQQVSNQQVTNQDVPSQVSAVTVYFDGARETRTASVDLKSGRTQLLFTGLAPDVDAKSIQLKSNGAFTVLGVNHQQNFLDASKPSAEWQKLLDERKVLESNIAVQNTYLRVIQEDMEFLKTNRNLGGRDQSLTVTALKESADYFSQRMTSLVTKEQTHNKNIEELNRQINAIDKQLNDMNNEEVWPTGEIQVMVEAKQATKASFELTYLVSNASWYPSYDIRANNITEPLEIVYKANIRQQTRSDWKNVKLTLSSYNPGVSGVAPELKTYFLDYNMTPPVYGKDINTLTGRVTDTGNKALSGVRVGVEGSSLVTSTNAQGYYSLTLPANATYVNFALTGYGSQRWTINGNVINARLSRSEQVRNMSIARQTLDFGEIEGLQVGSIDEALQGRIAGLDIVSNSGDPSSGSTMRIRGTSSIPVPQQIVQKQISVDFEINTPYSIASDNKVVSVDMAEISVPATYQYFSVPKIKQEVYLVAQLTDWQQYSFLEGEANVFFEDSYVGKTILNANAATDTLAISLGRDKSISVKREQVKSYSSKQFIGNKKEETRSWKITVRNNRKEPINLLLLDQVPVSRNEEIEVSRQLSSEGVFNAENGEVSWSTKLAPSSREFLLNYTVKYPKSKYLVIE